MQLFNEKKLISVQKIFIPYAFSVKYKLFRTSQSWDGAMLLTPVRLCIPPCGLERLGRRSRQG